MQPKKNLTHNIIKDNCPLMPKPKLNRIFVLFLAASFLACLMAVLRIYQSGNPRFIVYIWNLFLAWVPFMLAVFSHHIYSERYTSKLTTAVLWILGFIWLMFYPNAPYIITDYIHINVYNYAFKIKDSLEFGRNFWIWYDFVLISLFAWIGVMLGFVSLYLQQKLVKIRYNNTLSWVFVLTVLFMSAYGIYLGRFVRWNSWDIFVNPFHLLRNILNDLHLESVAFAFMFGLLLSVIYALLYMLTGLNKKS